MYATFRLTKNDINASFLETLKSLVKSGEIEVAVSQVDETEYLMQSMANKKKLMTSIKNIKAKKHLVEVDLKKLVREKFCLKKKRLTICSIGLQQT